MRVAGRVLLTWLSLAVALIISLTVEGCASGGYPAAVPAKGQDAETAERDERQCRERAVNAAESPAGTLLKTKIIGALGGAMLGAAAVVALAADGSTSYPNPY
jgi:hypothetical protein